MFAKLFAGICILLCTMVIVPFLELLFLKYFGSQERGWEGLEFASNLVVFTEVVLLVGGLVTIGFWLGR